MDGIIDALMTLISYTGLSPKASSAIILGLFILSEALSMTTKVKANGVFQLFADIIGQAAKRLITKK